MDIAITGHRPIQMPGTTVHDIEDAASKMMHFLKYITNKPQEEHTFHTGGALGVDQTVGAFLNAWTDAMHVVHSPGGPDAQGKVWPTRCRAELKMLISQSTEGACAECWDLPMDQQHFAQSMQRRNECMVDLSQVVFAYWRGTAGGTLNTIKYALSKGKPVYNAFADFTLVTLK